MFMELKQQLEGFCYHFWRKSMPKLNRYLEKGMPHPLEQIVNLGAQKKILAAVRAIEFHLMLSVIAKGIVQMLSLKFSDTMNVPEFRYMRTPSHRSV